jgi:hypothetical protein
VFSSFPGYFAENSPAFPGFDRDAAAAVAIIHLLGEALHSHFAAAAVCRYAASGEPRCLIWYFPNDFLSALAGYCNGCAGIDFL